MTNTILCSYLLNFDSKFLLCIDYCSQCISWNVKIMHQNDKGNFQKNLYDIPLSCNFLSNSKILCFNWDTSSWLDGPFAAVGFVWMFMAVSVEGPITVSPLGSRIKCTICSTCNIGSWFIETTTIMYRSSVCGLSMQSAMGIWNYRWN